MRATIRFGGAAAGALTGWHLGGADDGDCGLFACGFGGAVLGGLLGGAIGGPVAAHIANRQRGNIALSLLGSALATAPGMLVAAGFIGASEVTAAFAIAIIPLAQGTAAALVESSTSRN